MKVKVLPEGGDDEKLVTLNAYLSKLSTATELGVGEGCLWFIANQDQANLAMQLCEIMKLKTETV